MVNILTFFTTGSYPAEGLSPFVVVRDVDTTLIVTASGMNEIGDGWYKFNFIQYTGSMDYAFTIDGGTDILDARWAFGTNENFTEDVVTGVWGAQLPGHQVAGSFGEAFVQMSGSIDVLEQFEGGRWEITSTQMIFYAPDNTTELARFDLFDFTGSNTRVNATERVRV